MAEKTRKKIQANLNRPQIAFMGLPHKFRAFVGGFGSGKTWVGSSAMCGHYWKWPKINQGYFAPTYSHIRDIFFPTIDEVAFGLGLTVDIKEGNKEVHFYSGRKYRGTTICRSLDNPANIVGFKIGNALCDELDLLAMAKARQAWNKVIARMRYKVAGLRNGIDVATTPEGFKFVYMMFVKEVRTNPALAKLYGIVHASTFENEKNLPDDYISSLLETYAEELIRAYLNGQFTNLTAGTIYRAYDREKNSCRDVLQDGEEIHLGMDFNVNKMSAVGHVIRDGQPRAVDELMGGRDTPDMIRRIKERYWKYENGDYVRSRGIYIYPDASGNSRRSTNASATDISLLIDAGFMVDVDPSNPPVKDRINSMNAMFCNANQDRRYYVNEELCPTYSEALEQQVWGKTGEPDKAHDQDHPNDAAGYFIHKRFPAIKPVIVTDIGMAH